MRENFQSPRVWQPRGRGFSMGVVQPHGHVIHLTGQVAWDAGERLVGAGDVAAQSRQCIENIRLLLAEVGGTLRDVVSLTTYFVDLDDLPKIQAVREEAFAGRWAPASTSVRVAGLGHPDFLVELTPVAVVPESRFRGGLPPDP